MRKKLNILIFIFLLLLITALLLSGNYFYNQAVKRGTEVVLHSGPKSSSPLANDTDQQLFEDATEWFNKQEKNFVHLESDKGFHLQAQFIKQPFLTEKSVILAHGFRNSGLDMGKLAKFYFKQGFNVLLPDARGHGQSGGDYIGFGWHDRLDYLQWIDYLITYGEQQIVLHGESMGAATVLMTSGEMLPNEVKAVIADSSYSTVPEELAHQLKHLYNLPAFPLLNVTSLVTKVRAGYTFEEASVVAQAAKSTLPTFIIHGNADDLVPTHMAYQIYDALNSEKELWIVPHTGHTKAYNNVTSEFETRVQNFLAPFIVN